MAGVRGQSGQATEYVLTAVLVSIALIVVVLRYGGTVRGKFDDASESLRSGPTEGQGKGPSQPGSQTGEASSPAAYEPADSTGGSHLGAGAGDRSGIHFSISWDTAIWLLVLVAVLAMLYVMRMQKAIRKGQAKEKALRERTERLRSDRGQAMLEFFIAVLVGLVLILGIFQIALIYNARSLVKLAALNAARAAIVARNDDSVISEGPVGVGVMTDRARRAAFLTLLPVIPAIQGRIDPNAAPPDPKIFEKLAHRNRSQADMTSDLASIFGGRAAAAVYELFGQTVDDDKNIVNCLDVSFVPLNASVDDDDQIKNAKITSWPDVTFDDPHASNIDPDENLIKVVVTWRYPLVIPFVNRIITAVARPKLYSAALTAEGSSATVADMQVTNADDADQMRSMIPVWATGFAFTQTGLATFGAGGLAGNIANLFSGITVVNTPPNAEDPNDVGVRSNPASSLNEGHGEVVFTQPSGPNSIRQSLGEFLIFRIPIRATYVMRMQWDRKGA